MTNPGHELTRESLELLLTVARMPMANISGYALYDGYPLFADQLLADQWLIASGQMRSYRIDSRRHAEIMWNEDRGTHCYFDDGWHDLSLERIRKYSLNVPQLLKWVQSGCEISNAHRVTELIEEHFWYLGASRLDTLRLNIYFARCAQDVEVQIAIAETLQREAYGTEALVITDSPVNEWVVDLPLKTTHACLTQLLKRRNDVCCIERHFFSGFFKREVGNVVQASLGLNFSSDFRQVQWLGESYTLSKKQAAIFRALYREGGRAHKNQLCEAAETDESIYRLMRRKVNGKYEMHPLWGTLLLSEGNGYYYFDQIAPA